MSTANLQQEDMFHDVQFNSDLYYFINKYYESIPNVKSFKMRSKKLFVWSYEGSRQLVFGNIPYERREELYNVNVIAILLNVVVDDLADMVSDAKLLDTALQILEKGDVENQLFDMFPAFKAYLMLAQEIRNYLLNTIKSWPKYIMWLSDLAYFLKRLQMAMKRSLDFNQSIYSNRKNKWSFSDYVAVMAPPIHTFIYGVLNLMILDEFVYSERENIVHILQKGEQYMAMSNWISTWEVEIESRDFTSGVVVWALNNNVITKQELKSSPASYIQSKIRNCSCQEAFDQKMNSLITEMELYKKTITTFQVAEYIDNLRRVHSLHLDFSQMLKY